LNAATTASSGADLCALRRGMAESRDIIVIGGGHNGLVAAFYLARAGYKPLVLERREQVGGAAVTEEFHPGFRSSVLAHSASLRHDIVGDMQLEKHGLKLLSPEVELTALSPDGRALVLYRDQQKAMDGMARLSPKDAERFPQFQKSITKVAAVISHLLTLAPPEIESPNTGDLLGLLNVGRMARKLGKKDMFSLLRWAPMAVADLAAEFFETELLRATVAAQGIFGTFAGPWSAGTGLLYLLRAANGAPRFARGGAGAITQAMAAAAQKAGAEIRTGAEVIEIQVKSNVAYGVVLSSGEQLLAKAVVSNADPKRTFLKLTDPSLLSPTFTRRLQNYRMNGTVAKVNLALSGPPTFSGVNSNLEVLTGRIQIGPEIDYLERAFDESKYGGFSRAPYLEITIPSLADSSLAPEGRHVMSIYMQYAPYKLKSGSWQDDAQVTALGDTVVKTLAQYAPDLPSKILSRHIVTPLALEERYGLTGGHIFHGELALDQIFTMRPFLDSARYSTPIENLYLCGSGTHPGTGLTGASGANAAREILKSLKSRR
jgi:phytoene dehydrogenase-like protein